MCSDNLLFLKNISWAHTILSTPKTTRMGGGINYPSVANSQATPMMVMMCHAPSS